MLSARLYLLDQLTNALSDNTSTELRAGCAKALREQISKLPCQFLSVSQASSTFHDMSVILLTVRSVTAILDLYDNDPVGNEWQTACHIFLNDKLIHAAENTTLNTLTYLQLKSLRQTLAQFSGLVLPATSDNRAASQLTPLQQTESVLNYTNVVKNILSTQKNFKDFTKILELMTSFIATECIRLLNEKSFGDKLDAYTNLLLAIGFEAVNFEYHSTADNQLVLMEIFRRISALSTCATATVSLVAPSSQAIFMNWLRTQPLMYSLPFLHAEVDRYKHISDYFEVFPKEAQKYISNREIEQQRKKENAVIDPQLQTEERALQSRRANSRFSLFYPAEALPAGAAAKSCRLSGTQKAAVAVGSVVAAAITYRMIM